MIAVLVLFFEQPSSLNIMIFQNVNHLRSILRAHFSMSIRAKQVSVIRKREGLLVLFMDFQFGYQEVSKLRIVVKFASLLKRATSRHKLDENVQIILSESVNRDSESIISRE